MNPTPLNRMLMVHRLRWPALLLLTGVIALLDQEGILSWGRAWPLYLILLGVLALAERMAMAGQPPIYGDYPYGGSYAGPYSGPGYSGPGYSGPGNPASGTAPFTPAASAAAQTTGLVPMSAQTALETRASFPGNAREDGAREDGAREDGSRIDDREGR